MRQNWSKSLLRILKVMLLNVKVRDDLYGEGLLDDEYLVVN